MPSVPGNFSTGRDDRLRGLVVLTFTTNEALTGFSGPGTNLANLSAGSAAVAEVTVSVTSSLRSLTIAVVLLPVGAWFVMVGNRVYGPARRRSGTSRFRRLGPTVPGQRQLAARGLSTKATSIQGASGTHHNDER